jgi:hypothetical protein
MKTTADVPPSVAPEFAKAQRPSAIADATGSPGYTTTKKMQKGMQSKGQFGLPKSPGKGPPMQMGGNGPPPIRLHVTLAKDTDKDKM